MKYYLGFLDIQKSTKFDIGWEIIAAAQDSRLVHTFMVYELPEGLTVYETTNAFFDKQPLESRISTADVRLFELPGDATKALAFSEELLKKRTFYDYFGVVSLGLALFVERAVNLLAYPFRKLFGIKKPIKIPFTSNPLNMKRAEFCSESCIETMYRSIKDLPFQIAASTVGPSQLYFDYILPNKQFFGGRELTVVLIDGRATIVVENDELLRAAWLKLLSN